MKKSEIGAALVMAGLLVFAGLKFGEKNPARADLDVLIKASSQRAAGENISRPLQTEAGRILNISPLDFRNEDPAHTGIFVSILESFSFLMTEKMEKRIPPPADISHKVYLNYLRIIDGAFNYGKYLMLAGIFILLAVPIANKAGLYSVAAFTGRAGFLISRILIIALSIALLMSWILVRSGFWVPLNIAIFGAPAIFIILSSIALKMHDPNFPLWNRVMSSLIAPLVMSFIIVGNSIFFVESA